MALKITIRKIILSFIPHDFVRLLRRKCNINYFFFGASKKNVGTYIIQETGTRCMMYGMEQQLGQEVSNGFTSCFEDYKAHPGLLRKYVLMVEDCIVEPEYGWGITVLNDKLIFDSIANNTWRESYYPQYFKYKRAKSKAILIEEAISINLLKGGENNYWHFLHDLLGEITLALKSIPGNIPFLISKNLSEKPYFKEALLISPQLAGLRWIVRDDEYYQFKKIWFIQTMPNSNEQFFDLQKLLLIPRADQNANRKIFLSRSPNRIRFLQNGLEIEAIAKRYGFEVVDTDGISLTEQIRLFSETRLLIGIHGAGLTNVLFRKDIPLSLLELLPADYIQPHYFWLSKGMGHSYSSLVGSKSALNTSFQVNASAFEVMVQQLLKQ